MSFLRGLITRVLIRLLWPSIQEYLASDLFRQMITSAIVDGMKSKPAADIVSRLMGHMIMDPASIVEDQSDVLPVYDLLSSLGVPVYGPIIEEEELHGGGI